jgi:hypothetical protein
MLRSESILWQCGHSSKRTPLPVGDSLSGDGARAVGVWNEAVAAGEDDDVVPEGEEAGCDDRKRAPGFGVVTDLPVLVVVLAVSVAADAVAVAVADADADEDKFAPNARLRGARGVDAAASAAVGGDGNGTMSDKVRRERRGVLSFDVLEGDVEGGGDAPGVRRTRAGGVGVGGGGGGSGTRPEDSNEARTPTEELR